MHSLGSTGSGGVNRAGSQCLGWQRRQGEHAIQHAQASAASCSLFPLTHDYCIIHCKCRCKGHGRHGAAQALFCSSGAACSRTPGQISPSVTATWQLACFLVHALNSGRSSNRSRSSGSSRSSSESSINRGVNGCGRGRDGASRSSGKAGWDGGRSGGRDNRPGGGRGGDAWSGATSLEVRGCKSLGSFRCFVEHGFSKRPKNVLTLVVHLHLNFTWRLPEFA